MPVPTPIPAPVPILVPPPVFPAPAAGATLPTVPEGYELVDLIDDNGFETSTAGFEAFSANDGTVSLSTESPLVGARSLRTTNRHYGRIAAWHDYPYGGGPLADSLTAAAKLRVDGASAAGQELQVCAIAYVQVDSTPRSACASYPVAPAMVVDVSLPLPLAGLQLDNVMLQLKLEDGGWIDATLDEAHLYVVGRSATDGGGRTPGDDDGRRPGDDDRGPGDGDGRTPGDGGGSDDGDLPPVPDGSELVDVIGDSGFETSTAGFEPFSESDGAVSLSTEDPLAGAQSLRTTNRHYGRIAAWHDYPYGGGPLADSVTAKAKVRVDAASAAGQELQVCAIAYLQVDSTPRSTCRDLPVHPDPVDVYLTLDTQGEQLDNVMFQLKLEDGGSIDATVDEAHLYVVGRPAPDSGGGGGDGRGGGDPGDGGGGGDDPAARDLARTLGFHARPTSYRSVVSELDLRGDLSADGAAANAAPRDVTVALHPASDAVGPTRRVSFGLPLAPGTLLDTANVKVTGPNGQEIPAFVRSLGAWPHMPSPDTLCDGVAATGGPGIRSVLVQFDMAFPTTTPVQVTVGVNRPRTLSLDDEVPVRDTYREANDGSYAPSLLKPESLSVHEPAVLAAIDHRYLACASLVPMTVAAGGQPYLAATDQATDDFFYSVVNRHEVKQDWEVTDPRDIVDFFTVDEPWLYDRAQTFYNGYVRTGDVELLREANRASDQYQQQLYGPASCTTTYYPYCVGSFALKNPDPNAPYADTKYSYSENLLSNYLLTGDATVLPKIGYVSWGTEFHNDLTGTGDTERHRAFALMAHAIDYELTGNAHQLEVVQDGIATMRARQTSPLNGNPPNGCFNYAPEPVDNQPETFSPWMSSLLAWSFARAYAATGDPAAPPALVDLAQCELERGVEVLQPGQSGPMSVGRWFPLYIAASFGERRDLSGREEDGFVNDQPWWDGFEHSLDVAVPMALGAYFATDPQQKAALTAMTKELLLTHDESILAYTRGSDETRQARRSKYRVAPPRKYSWQYKNAGTIGWSLEGRPSVQP